MSSRNVDKGREAENAVATFLQGVGFPHAERRSKRGGWVEVSCGHSTDASCNACSRCDGTNRYKVPADAGDLTGIPGVVVQVKWSPYKPLAEDMRRTDEQRRAGRADIGLLVRKRKGVGLARAGEWDAYLPEWAVAYLLRGESFTVPAADLTHLPECAPWHTDLATAARLIRRAGYGATPEQETTAC